MGKRTAGGNTEMIIIAIILVLLFAIFDCAKKSK